MIFGLVPEGNTIRGRKCWMNGILVHIYQFYSYFQHIYEYFTNILNKISRLLIKMQDFNKKCGLVACGQAPRGAFPKEKRLRVRRAGTQAKLGWRAYAIIVHALALSATLRVAKR